MKYPESFAGYPASIKEAKSETAKDWTPRDVLISTLRDLDEGKIKTENLIVCWSQEDPNDTSPDWHLTVAYQNKLEMLGVLLRVINYLS